MQVHGDPLPARLARVGRDGLLGGPCLPDRLDQRAARPEDFDPIITVVDDWWGRPVSKGLTRLFLDPFSGTSLIAEHDHQAMGFTVSDPIAGYDGPALDRVVFVRATRL